MRYFLWLMPEPKAAMYWNGVIHRLALIYNQIPHMAHITLASWSQKPDLDFAAEAKIRAVELNIGAPEIGEIPWQRLYVPIHSIEKLAPFEWIEGHRCRNAHISLLYGTHSTGRCIDIQHSLRLNLKPILFSQIALIQGSKDVASWIEIQRWALA